MKLKLQTITQALSPSLKAHRPERNDYENFAKKFEYYSSNLDKSESEENLKTHLMDLLKSVYGSEYLVEQQQRIDFVIRTGNKSCNAGVLFETKRDVNKSEMIRKNDINRKAFHELILHFMRERTQGNTDLKTLVISTEFEIYAFKAKDFERVFFKNTAFRKNFDMWSAGLKTDIKTEFFYNDIAAPFIKKSDVEIEATHVDLRALLKNQMAHRSEKDLLKLYKFLGPYHFLQRPLNNDSNSLNKEFYVELLHIIGLEEKKLGSKRIIQRLEGAKRNKGSLLENTIAQMQYKDALNSEELILKYGANVEERTFKVGLELCLTWVNRILFLKLLEAQVINFQAQEAEYKFLSLEMVSDFKDLSDLFFKVLAFSPADRPDSIKEKYNKVPYLNSSLFEPTSLENLFGVNELNNGFELPVYQRTVLKGSTGKKLKKTIGALEYIFKFLDSYDFGAASDADLKEENRTIINAAVLGLIFEKINGYQDGAIFTPGYVTMYMSKSVIEKVVLNAFKQSNSSWVINDLDDVKNHLTDRSKKGILQYNKVIDNLKICDPAVGSGHFLVSCLNEIIALKSRLGILADNEGNCLTEYSVYVDNDELITVDTKNDDVFSYRVFNNSVPKILQKVQETLFFEKRKIIENCLFGVDINPNSVKICQLRLWIELLKSSYYKDAGAGSLQTLPNIDINIKLGNSVLSRTTLDDSLSNTFRRSKVTVTEYKQLVRDYRSTRSKQEKQKLLERLESVKGAFQQDVLNSISKDLNVKISELKYQQAQAELFTSDMSSVQAKNNRLDKIATEIEKLSTKKTKLLNQKAFAAAFEWRFEFPEILDKKGNFEGFDIIIANPPYGVSVTKEARKHITKHLGKVPDFEIYYLFLNLGFMLLKKGGYFNQIIPNTVLFNHFAKSYRERILNDWAEISIDDLTQFNVFEGVVVRNVIISGKKSESKGSVQYKKTNEVLTPQEYLSSNMDSVSRNILMDNIKNWGLVFKLEPNTIKLVAKLRASPKKLTDYFDRVSQGLIPYDKYQGQSSKIIESRAYHSKISSDSNSPWLNGEDVRRYSVSWNEEDYIEYCDGLANPRKPEYFREPRVLVREITNPRIFAAFTNQELYNDPAVINILESKETEFSLEALLAILNSKLATFFHFNASPKATKGAFPKILVADIKDFPLPDFMNNPDTIKHLSSLAKAINEETKGKKNDKVLRGLDDKIDELVYTLYGLDASDKALIEQYIDHL